MVSTLTTASDDNRCRRIFRHDDTTGKTYSDCNDDKGERFHAEMLNKDLDVFTLSRGFLRVNRGY